eukprot:CCRYP_003530-RA/>CCRYP_003530-RA protein AED:0.49 eAED:-0.02 QI:0/0/0/0.42/1/1/7/0/872
MIFKYIVGAALASGQVSGACIPYGSDPLAGNTFRGTDNGYEYTVNFGVGGTYLQKVLSTGGTYKVGNYDKLTGNVASFIQGDWCASINNYRSGTVTFEQDCSKSSLQLKSVGEPSICVYAMTPFNLEANCDANQKANCNSNSTTNPTANKQANCYANPNPYTHSNLKPNYATNIEPLNLEANCDANQKPTAIPTAQPTPLPTNKPTAMPTPIPTPIPTSNPTMPPTLSPSTLKPTAMPTKKPTAIPTAQPTPLPTSKPTAMPTPIPTPIPTSNPTMPPTLSPSTLKPTAMPTKKPTSIPTAQPTPLPTIFPIGCTDCHIISVAIEVLFAFTPPLTDSYITAFFWPSVSPSQSLGPSLSPTFLPTISPTTVPSLSSVPSLSPSIDPTVTPSSVPSSSPSIVEQTVIVPGSFSISTDICSLSEGQQYVLASASRKTIQEITCVNLSSCAVNIESVCGNNFMDKNRLLHLHTSRGLQAASWQIYYQVTYVFTCVTASCDSSKDKATSSTIISTVSDRVTFALSSGSFATVLSNNIKSGTSNFEFITSTCLVVWGVVGTPTMIDGPNQYNGTGFYYPDWDGGSGTCLQDGQAPLYMQKNPLYWMYANLEECCDRYFGGWNKNKCMNQQGSGLWYVNYALGKCVIDCDEVNGPLCGGLATSTEDDLFSDPLSCCESKLPWVAKTSCEAESFSSNCYCGTGKWYRGDKAGSNVCVRDCNKECGDDTCGGIVVDSFIALHNNVDECCKSEYNWIEGNLCSVKSMKSSEDDYWWPDMSNSKCIKGSDAPIMDLSVQLYSTVEACCVSGISWLSKSACVAASNKSTPQGSGKYFVDWVRTICKQDTGVDENVANSWDEQFDDMESCCDQIWWVAKNECLLS